jgi:hypothetical protein
MTKKLTDYIAESESPTVGDTFAINIREECLIESHIVDVVEDGVVIEGDDRLFALLEEYGYTTETIRRYGAVGSSPGMGYTMGEAEDEAGTDPTSTKKEHDQGYSDASRGINKNPYGPNTPAGNAYQAGQEAYRRHFGESQELNLIRSRAGLAETAPYQPETDADHNDPLAAKAANLAPVGAIGSALDEDGVDPVNAQGQDAEDLHGQATSSVSGAVDEAEYQGREVKLGKKMAGDVKKSKVYVRGPKGNVVKVNFGDPNMTIKKSNPARRKSFRARHNCDNPGPRWKARYWSCRSW